MTREHQRRTRIVATLGPATDPPAVLEAVLRAGVDVVRLNFSHGDPSAQVARGEAVRAMAAKIGREVGILADLPGPKIRIETFADGKVQLKAGSRFDLVASLDAPPGDATQVGVSYLELPGDVAPATCCCWTTGWCSCAWSRCRASASPPPWSTTACCPTARA
jgi:pyruvate kinase